MNDLTWNLFCATGNINTYLLYKELESGGSEPKESTFQSDESMGQLEINP